jgi:hypothetical protein
MTTGHERRPSIPSLMVRPSGLHFTIGAAPSGEVSLDHDLRLVKAALLYADSAKLCSYTSSLLLYMLQMAEFDTDQRLELLESVIPYLFADEEEAKRVLERFRIYKLLVTPKNPVGLSLYKQFQLWSHIEKTWEDLREIIHAMAAKAGMDGLLDALRSGLIELHTFQTSRSHDVTHEFFGVIKDAVSDGSTYPLLDDQTGNLIRLAIAEGKMSVSDVATYRGRHSALAGALLERLPLFDRASVTDILDIRRELQKPLVRFRKAVITFSETIKTAAWDQDFPSDVERIYYKEVEPAIQEIEDAVRTNKFLQELARKLVDKPMAPAGGSALAWVVSQASALPDVISQTLSATNATLAGAAMSTGLVAYDAFRDWRQKQLSTERNQLYFYYRASRELAKIR